ncbi:hypothetical protein AVEN_245764-1 [Araneus ventricosus]|uniref:Uncharacterized protein n=1 Tax=Araneus ventricosus TaxID=182803 RepID=A0A4Y2S764_ARAVE|nr:hypothetical protein AVEN_245764-1 [Araneus ventricosus]
MWFLVLQKHQFCFLTKPSRLKYSSSENYLFPKSISPKVHSLQHSVREIITSINGIHTQGLASLDLVWEHVKVLAHSTVRGHSKESVQHEMQNCERMSGAAVV